VSTLVNRGQLGASIGAAQSFKEFGDMVGPLLVGAITQWFGVRTGFVSCGAVVLACLVLANFAAASPR
jgi:MFS transporter, ACDE family, multidrug resistance protein